MENVDLNLSIKHLSSSFMSIINLKIGYHCSKIVFILDSAYQQLRKSQKINLFL